MSLQLNGTAGVTYNDGSNQPAAASPYGLKNRIINGGMVIDQRNAGASVTSGYPVDRWASNFSGSGTFTLQQSSDAPAGFNNSVLITSTSNNTIGASDYHLFNQILEGYNIADWNWGTSNAKTVTLSFWVKSSLTGTYSIQIQSGASTYVFYLTTYTIDSANTWEKKSITISGPTSGGFSSTNGNGFSLRWTLATGSSQTTATSDWATSGVGLGATGQADLSATNGNTFYLTGVQLEIGTTATPFENRMYGTELALCQRYYVKRNVNSPSPSTYFLSGVCYGSTGAAYAAQFPVAMRAVPTIIFTDLKNYDAYSGQTASLGAVYLTETGGGINSGSASGLGQGRGALLIGQASTSSLEYSAEL